MLSVSPRQPPDNPLFTLTDTPTNNIDVTGIEADDEEDTSDDDKGVFLGNHRPDELHLIAKLSASTPCSSSPVIRRVKKRDSREFMRRKTLLLSPITKPKPITRSVLTERQIEPDYYNDSESSTSSPSKHPQCACSTPMKSHDASDLTLDFAGFNLSSPQRSASPLPSQEESAGSDKENIPVSEPGSNQEKELRAEEVIVIGQEGSSEGSEDETTQLDMGGLRLSDFSDPETGFENSQSLEPAQSDNDSDTNHQRSPSPVLDLLPDGDTSSNLDSPLPIARAGPVVIPVLSSHHFAPIRAESGSPCRTFPPPPLIPIMEPFEDKIHLTQSDSPASLESVSEPTRLSHITSTPSQPAPLPPPELVERGAQLLRDSTTIKPLTSANLPSKSASRAQAIRGQLNTALSNRMRALGPPQRSVSTSSANSSSSTTSKLSSSSSSTARAGMPLKSSKTAAAPTKSSSVSKSIAPVQKKHTVVPLASSTTKTLPTTKAVPRPALVAKRTLPAISKTINKSSDPLKASTSSSIPLKRPAPASSVARSTNVNTSVIASSLPTASRFTSAPSTRPTLGQPSRNLHFNPNHQPMPLQAAPVFSVGVVGDTQVLARSGFRSPAKAGLMKKSLVEKGTPRKLGTPMRFGTPRMVTMSTPSTFSSAPIHDVSAVPAPISEGPPSTATRQATAEITSTTSSSSGPSSPPEPPRGSSADHEEVSVQLTKPPSSPAKSPSPKKKRPVGRPRKIQQPQAVVTVVPAASKTKPKSTATKTPAAGPPLMSEKELKTTTHRNTIRNQVYHCAIDRQIIRQSGPRPPSPTSKIRTTAERNEEEKKQAREARAKRRKGQEHEDEEAERPIIEKLVQHRHPGDDSDFETPQAQRPMKKHKSGEENKKTRAVIFDKGLTVIRDDGSARPSSKDSKEGSEHVTEMKSCLKAKVDLDHHGNLHEAHRPIENLKRTRVVVNAVFYDGEEPVPFSYSPSNGTRSKKK
ncbi:hypothetical protein I302_108376 [Kwoniella bestiolae CBS 10118]|uniref:Uncharacterized protein n=1 Tax=Kwoniella bestiolae CBS 10118 TaxID=1296100 RepID=A0A1B9FVW9_9TREE|nr:hypothetical protein I302_07250 [Kwoniella bestiolae CBS 10118]OCF22903.1 hypothetical protein I302_07250 [Kwoniella bestiolae CBS 10118]